jgi:3-deoxy-D-manno-octulosonic-acid transferase
VRKNYPVADHIFYLPLDTKQNAKDFIAILQPKLAIFIKYEFWYHYLTALYENNIPVLLISGIFRPEQPFFKFYGGMFRGLLKKFNWLFVQNKASLDLLSGIGVKNASLAGDTRFDRVWDLLEEAPPVAGIKEFIGERKAVIAGSTWHSDELMLAGWWRESADRCLIIAPHEVDESHIQQLLGLFPGAVRYSSLKPGSVLIIDNVGMLSALYRYARVTYVGGGFGKDGIHNILEPATYNKPVVFGPVYHKFPEAATLLFLGGAISVGHQFAMNREMEALLEDDSLCTQIGQIAGQYVADNKGATEKILNYIQEKRLV